MGLFKLAVKQQEVTEALKRIEDLQKEKRTLKEELEDLKLKKRLEQEEIKHLQRINDEKNQQEVESEKIRLEKQFQERISKFRTEQTEELLKLHKELHGKMEARFNTELGNLKEVYQALMARLPNVNLTLEKRLK